MIKVTPIIPKSLRMFAPAAHRRAIERTIDQGVDAAKAEIKAITRNWSSGVDVEVRTKGDLTLVLVADARWIYNDDPGTRPHLITPKRKTFLKFNVGGQTVFARQVRHPGTKPQYLSKKVQAKVNSLNLAATFSAIVGELTR